MANAPLRVLIADDERIARESMRDYLPWADMGMETPVCVENGALALDCLCHSPFDIFIMDIRMPVMDGMTLMEEIARRDLDVIIIVLSAYDQFEYAQKAIQSRKVFEYVLKPIRRVAFCEILQKAAAEAVRHKQAHRGPIPDLEGLRHEYLACLEHHCFENGLRTLQAPLEALLAQGDQVDLVRRFLVTLYTDTRMAALELWACFQQAVDALLPYLDPTTQAGRTKASAVVEHCLDEICKHYTEKDFSLNRLAEQMQLNPNYLSTRFKKETGVGYVNGLRVRRAQELLRDMRYRTNEVADLVGFENPRYFTRIFKDLTGVVPSEYRSRLHWHQPPAASGGKESE